MTDKPICARNFLKEGFYGQEVDEGEIGQRRQMLEPREMSQIILDSRRLPPPEIGNPFAFWGERKKIRWLDMEKLSRFLKSWPISLFVLYGWFLIGYRSTTLLWQVDEGLAIGVGFSCASVWLDVFGTFLKSFSRSLKALSQ